MRTSVVEDWLITEIAAVVFGVSCGVYSVKVSDRARVRYAVTSLESPS